MNRVHREIVVRRTGLFRFSMGTLLIGLSVFALVAATTTWIVNRQPKLEVTVSRGYSASESDRTSVPRYAILTFRGKDQPESIGIFVRTNRKSVTGKPQWLVVQEGRVYVGGEHIPFRSSGFRLVAAGDEIPPTQLELTEQEYHTLAGIKSFAECEDFWHNVLCKKHLPKLCTPEVNVVQR